MKTFLFCIVLMCTSLPAMAQELIKFDQPALKGGLSLEELLWQRSSLREYQDKTPSWEHIGKLLWAAQGVTRPDSGGRTAPSAWGAYPLDVYVIVPDGVWHYLPKDHAVEQIKDHDIWDDLAKAGLSKSTVHQSPCVFIFTADVNRLLSFNEILGDVLRYAHQESGHAAQNLILQAGAIGMGGCPIGANIPIQGQKVIGIPPEQKVVYIIASGYKKANE
jgi:SagB-type dehydrogenase family enzyme